MINEELRAITGTIRSENNLTSFLYELMRDHLPVGTVETIVRNVEVEEQERIYTNGFLALYAKLLTQRLTCT